MKSIADFCPEYKLFIEFEKQKKENQYHRMKWYKKLICKLPFIGIKQYKVCIPMTGNQAKFANWLLENKEDVSGIGNMHIVFNEVREYLKGETKTPFNRS